MPFLPPNQQRQSTEGIFLASLMKQYFLLDIFNGAVFMLHI